MSAAYSKVIERLREIADLRFTEALLGWDQQTYMPPKGNDARARQMALLTALAHERLVDPVLGDLMEQAAADPGLDETRRACLREAKRARDRAVKVPTALVRELSETAGVAHAVWVDARRKNDFALFAPTLKKLVALKRKEAQALGYARDGSPYDALLDHFEPDATVKTLDPVLARTRDIVVPAVRAIREAKRRPRREILSRDYSEKKQEKLGRLILKAMSFDFGAGRLDRSVHPFTTNFDVDDVRITTRYERHWLPGSVFGTVHEAGHALYEMGLPREHVGTPLGEARSLGLHESQSRFWENTIGRSKAFWTVFFPKARKIFGPVLDDVTLDDFHFAINAVEPSFIRVEADEVTYNLHIVVRYEVEKALFGGEVEVDELPAVWNDRMKAYLGIVPPDAAQGVLQDVHWSFGGFGYFPTYLLGNLYAAQWYAAIRQDFPDLEARVARGELLFILDWLRQKVHRQGRRYSSAELARRISGEELNPEHFGRYLKERFAPLYDVTW